MAHFFKYVENDLDAIDTAIEFDNPEPEPEPEQDNYLTLAIDLARIAGESAIEQARRRA